MNINTNEVIEAAATKWQIYKIKPRTCRWSLYWCRSITFKAEELGYINQTLF